MANSVVLVIQDVPEVTVTLIEEVKTGVIVAFITVIDTS